MKIKELLDSPEKWTKIINAKDKIGDEVQPESPLAICWCLEGAFIKCYGSYSDNSTILNKIKNEIGNFKPFAWNDAPERTFEDVRNLVEKLDI